MQTRHRIPTIFNLSMVDVLCCALGCVILLWLVNYREARRRAKAAGETGAQLAETRSALETAREQLTSQSNALAASKSSQRQLQMQLENTLSDRDRAQQLALATGQDLEKTRTSLLAAQADLVGLRKDLKGMQSLNTLLAADLGKKSKELAGLDQRLAAADKKASNLEKQLREKTPLLAAAGDQVEDLTGRLKDSAARLAKLEVQVSGLQAQDKAARAKLAAADAQRVAQGQDLASLKKELADVNRLYGQLLASQAALEKQVLLRGKEVTENRLSIADLEREKRALEDRIRIARQAADNRFAGIALTGRRVVFLVDMSGSMDLLDEQTPAPDKWPLLCETLAKIMKSLPDLTHYQVILFSDQVTYALGNKRRWLLYEKETSAKTVEGTLRKIKAKGGTNMAAAFAEAFEFRTQGMDTVYVFSDGLPNAGEGLPAGSENLSESQKTAYCTKYVRQMLKDVWNRRMPGQASVRLNAIGFFFESPDVGAFLWAMAREHDGSFVGMSRP